MGVRKFLVGLAAFALLIWGPIDSSWPFPLGIRLLYLVLLPTFAWFVLKWIWRMWRPDQAAEDRLARALAGVIAGVLITAAVLESKSASHFDCTHLVQTRDGQECVGDYVRVPGPDRGQVFLLIVVGAFAMWFGIRPPDQ